MQLACGGQVYVGSRTCTFELSGTALAHVPFLLRVTVHNPPTPLTQVATAFSPNHGPHEPNSINLENT